MANVPEHKKAELEELLHIHVKRHARGWNPVQLIEQHTLLCDAVLDERAEVARLRARVADSVPRAVAERACALMGAAVTAHCHDYPLSIIIACINADNVTWRIPAYASGELYRACIAHAERKSPRAEAGAKAQP